MTGSSMRAASVGERSREFGIMRCIGASHGTVLRNVLAGAGLDYLLVRGNNDRPVIDGQVIGKSAFRGSATTDVSAFLEGPVKLGAATVILRLEGFNLTNHGNLLGRGVTTIIGKAAQVSGFTVLASVLAFGALFGLIGAIIAVPIASGFQIVTEELTAARRARIAAADAAEKQQQPP